MYNTNFLDNQATIYVWYMLGFNISNSDEGMYSENKSIFCLFHLWIFQFYFLIMFHFKRFLI